MSILSGWRDIWPKRVTVCVLALWGMQIGSLESTAAEARVGVAANFTQAAQAIGSAYSRATGHSLRYSFGSTGQLYTQITQGAPLDVFLAADNLRPKAAMDDGLAVPGSQFTYALGKLALFSADSSLVRGPETLKAARFGKLAIANPLTAPYGAAALEILKKLGVETLLAGKIVRGNNIAQTYQFVTTGNADLGFVAVAQIIAVEGGSRWIIPQDMYQPIVQDAVLLKRGQTNLAARAFMDFLRGKQAQAILTTFGYGLPATRDRPHG